jgi:hypothetical protein
VAPVCVKPISAWELNGINSSLETAPGTMVHIFAPSLKVVGLSLLRTPAIIVDRFVKAPMARTRLLQKVKKTWRTHAIRKHGHEARLEEEVSG